MRKVILVYGEPIPKEHWLYTELGKKLEQYNLVQVGTNKHKNIEYRKYGGVGWVLIQFSQLYTAYKAIKISKKGDIIISQDYGTGRLCSVLSVISNKFLYILSLNCLQRRRKGIKRIIETILDNFAWSNKNYRTTVNSKKEYQLISIPETKKDMVYILEDTFRPKKNSNELNIKYDCFTGGYANRDYETYFYIASHFPDKNFLCVVGSNFDDKQYIIPSNVTMLKNVNEIEFHELMQQSKIICIPLIEDLASGLVVLKDAIGYQRLVIASETESVSNYIPKEIENGLLLVPLGNKKLFIEKMKVLFNISLVEEKTIIKELLLHNEQYSPDNQANKIVNILKDMEAL